MPASIPPVLAQYLQSCLQRDSLTLITSVLNTPANWVVLRFIKAVIFGVDEEAGVQPTPRTRSADDGYSVIFLSLMQSREFWAESGRKIGLDIPTLIAKKRVAYIDGLSAGVNAPQPAAKTISLKSHSLSDIKSAIATAAASTQSDGHASLQQNILVIDGLDFVLAAQPNVTAASLNALITNAQETCANVIITASADSPLLHNIEASATPLELQHSIFVRSIAHQSTWAWQLRPLETGHANDVSGVIQISRGGADASEDNTLLDGEWLYQVKGDGSVRVWTRGE